MTESKKKSQIQTIVIIAVIVAVCVIYNAATGGKFFALNNIKTLVSHAIIPCFMAWALCFVFACDYTDMSIGAVVVLAANMAGFLGETKLGYFGIIIGAVGVSVALMVFNFFLFAKSQIPSGSKYRYGRYMRRLEFFILIISYRMEKQLHSSVIRCVGWQKHLQSILYLSSD